MCCSKSIKIKKNYPFQYEDFSILPTDIAQTLTEDIKKEYSKFVIKERRFKKLIRLSALLPIVGIFICDKYQCRWYTKNKSFVYFINLSSFFVSLFIFAYLIIFVI
jgi:hypothetical protein